MTAKQGQVYNRADIVNFMGITEDASVFNRMSGFTEGGKSSNTETYDRRYIDEKTQRSSTSSYATEIGYSLDRMIGDPIHNLIADVHDDELTEVARDIVTVDFNQPVEGGYVARKRSYSINPDSAGDNTDAYTYSGAFKANGSIVKGVAKVVDGNENDTTSIKTVSFTPDGENATQLVTFNVSDSSGQIAGAKIVIDSSNTIYTDLNGIAMIDLAKGTYKSVSIEKDTYTTKSESLTVNNEPVYKAITLTKGE